MLVVIMTEVPLVVMLNLLQNTDPYGNKRLFAVYCTNKQQWCGLVAAASCGIVAACEFFVCKVVLLLLVKQPCGYYLQQPCGS